MNRLETKCLIASAGMHALLVAVLVFGAAFFKDKDADIPKTVFTMYPADKVDKIASGGNPNGGAKEIKDEPTPPAVSQPAVAPPPPPPPPPSAPVQPPPQAQPEPPKAAPEVVKVPVVNPRPTPTKPPKSAAKSEVPHIIETKGKPSDKKTSPTKSETKEVKKSDTKTDSKKPQVQVDLTRHVFNNTNKKQTDPNSKSREQAEKEAQDKADQAARDAWEKKQRQDGLKRQVAIAGSLRSLETGLSPGGLSMEPLGPGGGSSTEVYADYASVVLRTYDQAWVVGNEITDEQSTVKVSVTIARNGDVMSARIIKRSGNTLLDRTVQTALESVKFIAPFPDTTREAERTFTFTFNLKAKRQLG